MVIKPQTIKEKKHNQSKEFEKVLKRLNFNENYHPSKSQVYVTINQLEKDKIVFRKESETKTKIKRVVFFLSELGVFMIDHNYQPNEISKIVAISHLIFIFALRGIDRIGRKQLEEGEKVSKEIWVPEQSLKNLPKKKQISIHRHAIEHTKGVAIKELFELQNRNISDNSKYLNINEHEMKNYIQFMQEKKILRPIVEKGQERFVPYNEQLEKFIQEILNLYTDIDQKIEFKIGYLASSSVEKVEKEWCLKHRGKKGTQELLIFAKEIRDYRKNEEKKKIDSEIKMREHQIKSMNSRIIEQYDSLNNNYTTLFPDLPGMNFLILSNICPRELIETFKKEHDNQYSKKENFLNLLIRCLRIKIY